MKGKLWNKLFRQAIPFFVMVTLSLTAAVSIWSLILCTVRPDSTTAGYAVDLAKEFVIGVAVAVIAFALGTAADHWLQDHYLVDNKGKPRSCKPKSEDSGENPVSEENIS